MRCIEAHDTIALDGGSTTLEIARMLDNVPITVVTNDLYIIGELVRKDRIRLVVPGGYRVRNMLAGAEAAACIRNLNIQKAFLSATGVHLEHGLTIYTGDFVDFKRALVETAHTVYGVVDHYKFGSSALRTFASLAEITAILTDSGLSPKTAEPFERAGLRIEYR